MASTVNRCQHCFLDAQNTAEKQLFVCGVSGCRVQWKSLCFTCGTVSHGNKNVFNHVFGHNSLQIQAQYKKTIVKYDSTTSNTNNVKKKGVAMGGLMAVGAYQVGMLKAAKEFGVKEALKKFSKDGWNLTKFGKNVTGGIQIALCVWECGNELHRYNNGIISGKECSRLIVRSITANSAAFGGAIGGAAFGGAIGGLPGCIVGGIVGGMAGDLGSRFIFDKIWEKEDEKDQEKDINEALHFFRFIGLTMDNVSKAPEFNREELQKEYHLLALKSHPDSKYGTPEKFEQVLHKYNILLGVLKKNENI
eukprot:UN02585